MEQSCPRARDFVLCSDAPAAVEESLLAAIQARREHDPLAPVDVLVGGVLLRPYLQRLIADTSPGLLNVRFSTLGELGLRLGEPRARRLRAAAAARRSPSARTRPRSRAAATATSRRSPRRPASPRPSRQLVRELRREGDLAGRARPRRAGLPRVRGEGRRSRSALPPLPRRTRRLLRRRGRARSRRPRRASTESSSCSSASGGSARTRRRLVEALAERVPVTVFLPTVGEDADDAHAELRAWLLDRGAQLEELARPAGETALAHAPARPLRPDRPVAARRAASTSSPRPTRSPRPARPRAPASPGPGEGIAFREMAVTYRQAELYRPLVEAVFAEAGIPVYLDDGPSLAERPLGRRILALLDLVDSPLRRRDVMAFLTDGCMPRETRERFGGAPRRALGLDLASRRASSRGSSSGAHGSRLLRDREAERRGGGRRARVARSAASTTATRSSRSSRRSPPTSAATRSGRSWSESLAFLRRLLETYVRRRRGRARLPRPARRARRARPRGRLPALPRRRARRGARRSRRATSTRDSRARSAGAA